jgi:hypothetical protein
MYSSALNILRMVKLFAWEARMLQKLKQKREEELAKMRRGRILEVCMFALNDVIPAISSLGTLTVYVSSLQPSDRKHALSLSNALYYSQTIVMKGNLSRMS